MKKKEDSPNFRNGSFQNLSHTPVMKKGVSYFTLMKHSMNRPANVKPPAPIPSVKTDLKALLNDEPCIIWFGHSTYLIIVDGFTVLVDPVLSGYASPFSFMVKAFPGSNVFSTDDLPPIDMLIITHNHYDHLDATTIPRLKNKVKKVYTALGVGRDIRLTPLEDKIHELDWWDELKIADDIELIAAPARHFSGRGLKRGGSLWASFILNIKGYRLYLGGDSGYDKHFTEIGKRFGPFNIALLECGQYNEYWPFIHMMPEECVQAAMDLNAKLLMPVHWGKFALALHAWDDSIKRVVKKAKEMNMPVTTPRIGEPVFLHKSYPVREWWTELK